MDIANAIRDAASLQEDAFDDALSALLPETAFNCLPVPLAPTLSMALQSFDPEKIARTVIRNMFDIGQMLPRCLWLDFASALDHCLLADLKDASRNAKLSLLLILSRFTEEDVELYLPTALSCFAENDDAQLPQPVVAFVTSPQVRDAIRVAVGPFYSEAYLLPPRVLQMGGVHPSLNGWVCFGGCVAVSSVMMDTSTNSKMLNMANLVAHESAHAVLREGKMDINAQDQEAGYRLEMELWHGNAVDWTKSRHVEQLAGKILEMVQASGYFELDGRDLKRLRMVVCKSRVTGAAVTRIIPLFR